MISEKVDKEKLLDNFPLSEHELDRLICFYNASAEITSLSLSKVCSQVHEQSNSVAPPDNSTNEESESWPSALEYVEEVVLPEIFSPKWFHNATQYVSPLLPYDGADGDEETSQAFSFLEAMASLLGRRGGPRFVSNFIFDAVRIQAEDQTTADAYALVDLVYRHVRAALHLQGSSSLPLNATKGKEVKSQQPLEPPSAWVLSLKQAVAGSNDIRRGAWNEWVNNTIPEAMKGISTLYHYILFSPWHPFGTPPSQFTLPQPDQEHHLWSHMDDPLPLTLACTSPVFRGRWYRIFSSNFDGLSFLSFQTAILEYPGPTVVLVRRKGSTGVFGYYSDCPWKESNTWIGGDSNESFLFKVDKSLAVYHPTYESSNGHYMYLNSTSTTTNGSSNVLQGLAIGGIAADTPRVHLTTSFENCTATATDTTYASGALVDPEVDEDIVPPSFDVDAIEVWAVNVTEAEFLEHKAAGQKRGASRECARQKVAKVDRAQFLDDFRSGAVINNLFAHRHEARGRHDFVAAQDGRSGYFVDDKPPSAQKLLGDNKKENA